MACVNCNIELCYMCDGEVEQGEDCCCKGFFYEPPIMFDMDALTGQQKPDELEEKRPVGRPRMNPEDMKDALRAGRDRARRTLKIPPGTLCQWANLKFAGGGIRPIVGCIGLPAGARHHGPDKSTHDNTIGLNLHLICVKCHNRWHARNDEFYDERPKDGSPYVPRANAGVNHPHDPNSTATDAERFENELFWQTPKAKRVLETQVILEPEEPEEENSDLTDGNVYGTMDIDNEEEAEE